MHAQHLQQHPTPAIYLPAILGRRDAAASNVHPSSPHLFPGSERDRCALPAAMLSAARAAPRYHPRAEGPVGKSIHHAFRRAQSHPRSGIPRRCQRGGVTYQQTDRQKVASESFSKERAPES